MMIASQKGLMLRDFQRLFSSGSLSGLSDGQLVERYVAQREEAVFEAIVHRQGPMVWGVCRRVLRDHHDAEDAFQASFLVLARKASSIVPREMVGNWLYGVAYQTAVKARASTFKRRGREKQVPEMPEPEAASAESGEDVLPVLDQELSRLPDKYRVPIVLCELEGKSHREAAEQLGWPVGTVSGRLSRARAMLAKRMARHGFVLTGGSLAVLLSQSSATARVPVSLIAYTTKAATLFAAGQAATGVVVSARVAALTEGVLKTMLMTKLKIATAGLMVLVALGAIGLRSDGLSQRAKASSPVKGVGEGKSTFGAVGTAGNADSRAGVDPKEEMKKLEGTWAITDAAEEGIRATAEQKAKGIGRVVIKGDRMTIKSLPHSGPGMTFAVSVDPSKSPKLIGLILLNDKMEDDENQSIRLGIYELKGDTLTICFGTDRPDSFEVVPGSKRNLIVLKWAKW